MFRSSNAVSRELRVHPIPTPRPFRSWEEMQPANKKASDGALNYKAQRVRPGIGDRAYSERSASNGEIELARSAGIKDAMNAESPSTRTAAKITVTLNGSIP